MSASFGDKGSARKRDLSGCGEVDGAQATGRKKKLCTGKVGKATATVVIECTRSNPRPPPPPKNKGLTRRSTYSESTQRTLGRQFHTMDKTLRIVCLSGKDPLVNDLVWFALCADLVSIKFCNPSCSQFAKRKCRDFDNVPLSLRPHENDWTVYRRVLNQIPLLNAVHLSIFRWLCALCVKRTKRAFAVDALPSSTLIQMNQRIVTFLRVLVSPSFDPKAFAKVDQRPSLPVDRKTSKVKFRLTSLGQNLLVNACSTFQPVIPKNCRLRLENSLRHEALHCPVDSLANESTLPEDRVQALYYHETTRENVSATNMLDLGGLKWYSSSSGTAKLDATTAIRHCILQHLSGFIEGCAIFGMRQLFGNGMGFDYRVEMIEAFVDGLSETLTVDKDDVAKLLVSPSYYSSGILKTVFCRNPNGKDRTKGTIKETFQSEYKPTFETQYIGRQRPKIAATAAKKGTARPTTAVEAIDEEASMLLLLAKR